RTERRVVDLELGKRLAGAKLEVAQDDVALDGRDAADRPGVDRRLRGHRWGWRWRWRWRWRRRRWRAGVVACGKREQDKSSRHDAGIVAQLARGHDRRGVPARLGTDVEQLIAPLPCTYAKLAGNARGELVGDHLDLVLAARVEQLELRAEGIDDRAD